MTVLVGVAEEVRAGAVAVGALELAKAAVSHGASGGLIRAIPAVGLTVTLPPDGDAAGSNKQGHFNYTFFNYKGDR